MISLDYFSNTCTDQKASPKYLNSKLEDGAKYAVFQPSFDKDNAYKSEGFVEFETKKDHSLTIMVVVVVLIVVVAAIGAGIFCYHLQQNSSGNGDEEMALKPQKRLRTLTNKLRGQASGAFGKSCSTINVFLLLFLLLLLLLLLFTQFVVLLVVLSFLLTFFSVYRCNCQAVPGTSAD